MVESFGIHAGTAAAFVPTGGGPAIDSQAPALPPNQFKQTCRAEELKLSVLPGRYS
jgi:hypothetical protein